MHCLNGLQLPSERDFRAEQVMNPLIPLHKLGLNASQALSECSGLGLAVAKGAALFLKLGPQLLYK